MNTFCPNLSNKQVKQEFETLVNVVGEDAAYLIWHRNNGYAIDSAPNGAKSLLFQNLLKKYHGDYNKAVQEKSKYYLSQYTDKNGKWYENSPKQVELTKPGVSKEAQQKLHNAQSFIKNHLSIKKGPIRNRRNRDELNTLKDYVSYLYNDITGQQLQLDSGDIYDNVDFAVNNTDFESVVTQQLQELKNNQKKPNNLDIQVTKSLISSFLSNPEISNYNKEQQEILKKHLPSLFKTEKSITKQKIGFYKHNLEKIYKKIESGREAQWQEYFINRSKQIKLQNFLDYLELSPDYKQQIKQKIYSEMLRYVGRTNSTSFDQRSEDSKLRSKLTFMSGKGAGVKEEVLDFSEYYNTDSFKVTKYGRIEYGRAKSSSVLQKIVNNKDMDQRLRKSAQFLLKYIDKNKDFEIIFLDPGDSQLAGEEGELSKTAYGASNVSQRTIYIKVTNSPNNKESTLIHEIAHSITSTLLEREESQNSNIWKGLQSYMDYISKFMSNSFGAAFAHNYWRTNPYEFVAEFFGNGEFQDMLKEIPASEKQDKFNNIFEQLLNWIHELFTKKPTNAFEQIKPAMEGLVIQQYEQNLIDSYRTVDTHYLAIDGKFDVNGEPLLKNNNDNNSQNTDTLSNLFTNDNNQVFKNYNSSRLLLQHLIDSGYIMGSFKPFAEILSRHDIPIVMAEDDTAAFMSTYVDKNDGVVISINSKILDNVSTGFAAQKLMHEVIHALTVNALTEGSQTFDKELNKATEKLFSIYNKAFPKERFSRNNYIDGYNGLRDKYEFVSEFLTNQDFRNLLFAKAKELDSKNKSSKVLEKIRNFVKRLISTFVGKTSNQEELQKYQMQLFNYINNKNAIVNGNIKSKEQLKKLVEAVDNYKFIAENLIQNDELLQKLSSDIQKHDFSFGVERINKFIQHSAGYQTKREIQQQLANREHRKPLYFESASKTLNETVIPEITKALETRLKAVRILDISSDQKHQMISGIESQISALQSDTVKNINSIAYVLNAILPDILDESQKIHDVAAELYRNGNYVLSNPQYMYEMHDYFGVYQNILQQIQEFFAHPGIDDFMKDYQADDLSLMKNTNDFIEKVETCKSLCDTCVGMLKQICSANVIARLKNIGVETDNSTDMQDYIDSEMGSYTTHDMSGIAKLFGSADSSSDHLVRALSYIVNKAASAAQVSITNRVSELQMLQHNLKHGESVLQLYEKDENGLPTGYLVRKLNYGKFKKDYDNFMADLNRKYSTKEEPLDPSNRIPPTNKENRVKWSIERNNWLGAHCHRQFNAEYYNKFANLSAITKKRRDDIQIAINAIRSTVLSDDGTFYDYNKLSDEDWNRLRILYMQRRQLANIYDVSGEKKEGDDLLVAQEIKELNASLYDGNKAKRNVQKWKESRNKIIAECGGISEMEKGRTNIKFDWKKLDQWDERNSKTQFKLNDDGSIKMFEDIKNEKLELLKKYKFTDKQIEDLMDGDNKYNQNKKRINEMIAPYRRLDNGEVDASILPEQIKQKVIALQKENSKILIQSKSILKKTIRKKLSEIGKQYYDIKWTQQFADMLQQARRLDAQNAAENGLSFDDESSNVSKFLVTHGFLSLRNDGFGGVIEKFTPYQFYTKIVPKDYDKYMEIAPGDNYIEQDPESSFLDKDFDPSENETYIPLKEGMYNGKKFSYDNRKAYDEVQNSKTLFALYNKVKQTIHETNEIYSNIPFKNDYQLPGITGTYWKSLVRGGSQGKWSALFKERFGRIFKTTEKDVDYQHIAATRPDGHQLSFIPQPYTAQLKDPTQISTDLVGIVSQYYAKGQNYKEKSKIKDDCETIVDFLENRDFVGTKEVKKGIQTNTYQAARKFLNMQIYNQQNDKLEIAGFNVNKAFGIAKAWATMMNLGLNIKVATVGATSAFYAHTMNAICGKGYGLKDWATAMYQMNVAVLESGFGTRIIGQNSRLFQQNLMEFFDIADQAEKKYKNTNRNAVVNQLCENWCFGMMTMSDYLVKGSILDATLSAHRFYKGKFLSKDDLRRKYADKNSITGGDAYQEALKEWKEGVSFLSVLRQAHKDGNRTNMFNIPYEYKEAVDNSFFFIQKRAQIYAARADGVMTATQKAAFMTGMTGQALMMHKQYLQPMIQYYYGAKQYNLETQQYTYGTIRAVLDFIINPYKDGVQAMRILNADNAFQSPGLKKQTKAFLKGFASGLKTQAAETLADPINRQAIKRIILELSIYNFLLYPLVSLILRKADEDRDNTLLQLIAYISIATRWEVLSQYRFADVLNTMKSPTAMTSVWDGLNAFMDSSNSYKTPENSLWNVFSNVKDIVSNEKEGDEVIDRGAYKGWTRKDKSLIKITPFKNLYEQLEDPYTKRKYVQNQMYKQKD